MFADGYDLGAKLGEGGMAVVFEAVARGAHGFTRRVAIKRLLPQFAKDDQLTRMFLDEARTASHLHHAGIVGVLDFGVVDGAPFQVLELVEGWNMDHLVERAHERGARVPTEVALLVMTEVAHALAYAHERTDAQGESLGIVHRDVKPSNILISTSGDIKLGDFGIALARERSAVTTGFSPRGTPGYMSPEQRLGVRVEPTSDVFAAGVSLHDLLATHPLLEAGAHQQLLAGQELAIREDLPRDVRAIIERAVRVKPSDRYPSARELARVLGEALAPRLGVDGKSRIVAWLAELGVVRAPLTPPRVPVVIVPAKHTGSDHAMQFVTTLMDSKPVAPLRRAPQTPVTIDRPATTAARPQPVAPPSPPSTAARGWTVFAAACLLPLALGAIGLAVFVVQRPPASAPTSPTASTVTDTVPPPPPQLATASASSSSVVESPPPSFDAGAPKPPTALGPYLTVKSVVIHPASRRALMSTLKNEPPGVDAVIAALEAVGRRCLIGRAITPGAEVHVDVDVESSGRAMRLHAYESCVGRTACRVRIKDDGAHFWVPGDAVACVESGAKTIAFPPLVPAYTQYEFQNYLQLE
jgi:serine/threonine protein kinase